MNHQTKIQQLEEEIAHLKEYLLSDCCRQCSEIISKIDKYREEITLLNLENQEARIDNHNS
jgi:hypothetical protein